MENELREPAVAYGKSKFTIEEYLEFEKTSEEKHEYYQGEIFAMSGSKVPHNTISVNIYSRIKTKIKRQVMPTFQQRSTDIYPGKFAFYLSGYFDNLW